MHLKRRGKKHRAWSRRRRDKAASLSKITQWHSPACLTCPEIAGPGHGSHEERQGAAVRRDGVQAGAGTAEPCREGRNLGVVEDHLASAGCDVEEGKAGNV